MITRTTKPSYLYTCTICFSRFVGYGDRDPAFRKWREEHSKCKYPLANPANIEDDAMDVYDSVPKYMG